MSRIDQLTIQRILDTADIVDVVSEFVTLKRRGSNYVGLCPFHNERTPSFSVSKSKGICKCFSCGKGGNVVNFLMELQQMSYGEALRWLAAKYGIEIQEHEVTDEERKRERERESLQAVLQFACDFYKSQFASAVEIRDTAAELDITPVVMENYFLGRKGAKPLALEAARLGFTSDVLTKAGVVDADGNETVADYVMPVISRYGKPVALLTSAGVGKPVNVTASLVNPDDEFYGYFQARKEAAKLHCTAVTPNPWSVLHLAAAGVSNVLCTLTPGYGERRINLLRKLGNDIVVVLPEKIYWDGYRVMAEANILLHAGMSVRVATADQLIAGDSVDIVSFKLKCLASINNMAGIGDTARDEYIKFMRTDLFTTIASVTDSILSEIYVDTAAQQLGISPESVLRKIKSKY